MTMQDSTNEKFAGFLDNLTLRVLGYKENQEEYGESGEVWVALALEMDLRGRGSNFEQALQALQNLIEMQIGFAIFKNDPSLIFREADPEYFERWEKVRAASFESVIRQASAEMHSAAKAAMNSLEKIGLQLQEPSLLEEYSHTFSIPPAYVISNLHRNLQIA